MTGAMQRHVWDQSTGTGAISMGIMTLQPGTELSPHYHLVEDAMVVISGRGTFILKGEETPVEAGDGMMAPAGTVHYIRNDGNEPLVLVYAWPAVQVERFTG